ncbi:MAG TPA: hypothetical protein VEB00_04850 [Clostridia bacterium]|nr:hypothetical protein [Clostridia bacterium]
MPTLNEHVNQYNHNKSLLSNTVFDINNTTYKDWVVTITFYNAVHLIERELAKITTPYHSGSHTYREKAILREKKLKTIAAKYQALYNQSIRARYECYKFSKKDVEGVMHILDDIEKALT